MTRRFIQPVAIPFIEGDIEGVSERLQKMGYTVVALTPKIKNPAFWVTNFEGHNDWVSNINHPGGPSRHSIEGMNWGIFFALAAMSEGPDFYPGEMVINKNVPGMFTVDRTSEGNPETYIHTVEGGDIHIFTPGFTRKATKEEIIAHFSAAVAPAAPWVKAQSVIGEVTVDKYLIAELDPDDIAKNHHEVDGRKIFTAQPTTDNEIRQSAEMAKSFFDQVAEATRPEERKIDPVYGDSFNKMIDLINDLLETTKTNNVRYFLDEVIDRLDSIDQKANKFADMMKNGVTGNMGPSGYGGDVQTKEKTESPDEPKFKLEEIVESIGSVLKERSEQLKNRQPCPFPPGGRTIKEGGAQSPYAEPAEYVITKSKKFADMAKLSRALDEWVPYAGEVVECRMGDSNRWSQRVFICFIEGMPFLKDEDDNSQKKSFRIHQWDEIRQCKKPIELDISELVAFYSQHTGTDPKLIKVKK